MRSSRDLEVTHASERIHSTVHSPRPKRLREKTDESTEKSSEAAVIRRRRRQLNKSAARISEGEAGSSIAMEEKKEHSKSRRDFPKENSRKIGKVPNEKN